MTIIAITYDNPLWNRVIDYARTCSWKAGPELAVKMINHDFQTNERVLVALDEDNIAGYCTFTQVDELPAEYEFTPFIGFMFVDEHYRGHRLSGKLIRAACEVASNQGYGKVHIMSGEKGLYEKYGFVKIGEYRTIYDTMDQLFYKNLFKVKKYQELTIDELYEILRSRAEIFVVEQDCVYQDLDGIDRESLHIFSEEDGRVTSYARIFPDQEHPGILRMGRVLTLVHGTGLGGQLLKESIYRAKEWSGAKKLYIEAQCYATGYYEREGFVICTEEFLEDGIPHVGMILELASYK